MSDDNGYDEDGNVATGFWGCVVVGVIVAAWLAAIALRAFGVI